MEVRFCKCGRILNTQEITEGMPCRICRKRKGIKMIPLDKKIHKPNPAPNTWLKRQEASIES